MAKLAERITVDPEQCGGRPCIRGMRIHVTDVLDLLANGLTAAQVLEELPDSNWRIFTPVCGLQASGSIIRWWSRDPLD